MGEQQDPLAEIKAMAEGIRRQNRLVADGDPRRVLGEYLDWLIGEVEALRRLLRAIRDRDDSEIERLRGELEIARKTIADLRATSQ